MNVSYRVYVRTYREEGGILFSTYSPPGFTLLFYSPGLQSVHGVQVGDTLISALWLITSGSVFSGKLRLIRCLKVQLTAAQGASE